MCVYALRVRAVYIWTDKIWNCSEFASGWIELEYIIHQYTRMYGYGWMCTGRGRTQWKSNCQLFWAFNYTYIIYTNTLYGYEVDIRLLLCWFSHSCIEPFYISICLEIKSNCTFVIFIYYYFGLFNASLSLPTKQVEFRRSEMIRTIRSTWIIACARLCPYEYSLRYVYHFWYMLELNWFSFIKFRVIFVLDTQV